MREDLSGWARRIRALREARGMTQVEAAEQMRQHSDRELPDTEHLLRRWKSWESGASKPTQYASIVAATLGTVTASLFPPEHVPHSPDLLTATGMDTLEIVSRLDASEVNSATIDGLRITVEALCSSYASQPADELIIESRTWLRRVAELQEQRLSFAQRRETLQLAGWLALLVGCLEYDLGDRRRAESTRQAALKLGTELGSPGIIGWAHEMRAWFALTTGDYRGVITAAEAGAAASGNHSVGVQLVAQQAKAYARMGRKDDMARSLERGRRLLEGMPYPDNISNHFVVDPAKFDFYAMDCYRHVGDDQYARTLADEVIRDRTDFTGREQSPMRIAEAQITLGVAAAREGDLEEAVSHGRQALAGKRKSLPSLAMVADDLATVLRTRYSREAEADSYLEQLRSIQRSAS